MKKILLLAITFSITNIFAEIWKDYEPSEQQVQLTVIDVKSNDKLKFISQNSLTSLLFLNS